MPFYKVLCPLLHPTGHVSRWADTVCQVQHWAEVIALSHNLGELPLSAEHRQPAAQNYWACGEAADTSGLVRPQAAAVPFMLLGNKFPCCHEGEVQVTDPLSLLLLFSTIAAVQHSMSSFSKALAHGELSFIIPAAI